jgi:catechol 2,3-dioxygenase-like lactoylglutathione lyase family enzyme
MATVKALDHVNIQTADVAATARFFADVLDLEPRQPFPGADMAEVTWMFDAQDRPVVHVTRPGMTFAEDAEIEPGPDTRALHHVAFECDGHSAMLARLHRLDLAFRQRDIPTMGLKQLFVRDPNGVLLELNFRGASAL